MMQDMLADKSDESDTDQTMEDFNSSVAKMNESSDETTDELKDMVIDKNNDKNNSQQ